MEFEKIRRIAKVSKLSEVKVDRIHLFKSEQIGNKRVYTAITEYKF